MFHVHLWPLGLSVVTRHKDDELSAILSLFILQCWRLSHWTLDLLFSFKKKKTIEIQGNALDNIILRHFKNSQLTSLYKLIFSGSLWCLLCSCPKRFIILFVSQLFLIGFNCLNIVITPFYLWLNVFNTWSYSKDPLFLGLSYQNLSPEVKEIDHPSDQIFSSFYLAVKNADCSPVSPRRTPTKMGSCCGVTASQESISLLPSTPDSRVPSGIVTPVTPQAALSAEGNNFLILCYLVSSIFFFKNKILT